MMANDNGSRQRGIGLYTTYCELWRHCL